jgi:hypothetical protein
MASLLRSQSGRYPNGQRPTSAGMAPSRSNMSPPTVRSAMQREGSMSSSARGPHGSESGPPKTAEDLAASPRGSWTTTIGVGRLALADEKVAAGAALDAAYYVRAGARPTTDSSNSSIVTTATWPRTAIRCRMRGGRLTYSIVRDQRLRALRKRRSGSAASGTTAT